VQKTVLSEQEIVAGTPVYRVWGGDAKPWGSSSGSYWTTVDPRTVENYRSVAGLPNENTGRFVSEGILLTTQKATPGGADVAVAGRRRFNGNADIKS
jgi:hypothetical protein